MEAISWDYDRWQGELDRVLLRERSPAEPVVLFVSREMLQEYFPFFGVPLDSLAAAVLEAMQPSSTSKAFGPIRQRLATWQRGSRTSVPPVLPIVAVTVAAAADMGADERGGPLMYYGRLQEILGHQVSAAQLGTSFEDVASMWRALNEWITDQAWLGPSTIVEDTHFSRIGFARSQAVMSKQDVANLRDFFFTVGSSELDKLTPGQLTSELKRWNRKFKRLTRALTRILEGNPPGPAMNLLASILPLLARKWDGQPREHQSQTQLRVQIRLDLDAWAARWVVPRRQGIDALEVCDGGRELTLSSTGFGSFYRTTGLPDSVASSIDSSPTWTSPDVRIQLKPRKAWTFAIDAVSGDWVSTNAMDPFDEIALLIREDQADNFSGILDAVGVEGYKRIGGSRQIVRGWDLFLRVKLSDNADDTRLVDWLGYGIASLDEPAEAPRLVNGLSVRSRSGVQVYVAGGEPDLVVPATPFGTYSISLDGSDEMELRANGSALPLHKLVAPGPASHFLFINDSHILEFETIGVDDVNLVPSTNYDLDPVSYNNRIAVIPVSERMVLARSAAHWSITRAGAIIKIAPPEIPEWLSNAGYTNEYRFDAEMPAEATWLVTIRREVIRSIKKLKAEDFEPTLGVMKASVEEWQFLAQDDSLANRSPEWLNVVYQARRLLRF